MERITEYLTVVAVSMFKFLLGPVTAYGLGLTVFEAIPLTALGMMITCVGLSFIGGPLRERGIRFFAARFSRDGGTTLHPRLKALWERWGIVGIAMLTPIALSPPGGVIVALLLGVPRERLIPHMAWSAVLWSVIYGISIYRLAGWLGFSPPT